MTLRYEPLAANLDSSLDLPPMCSRDSMITMRSLQGKRLPGEGGTLALYIHIKFYSSAFNIYNFSTRQPRRPDVDGNAKCLSISDTR